MNKFINSQNISALVFDLDGTLYPRNIYLSNYYNFTVKSIVKLFEKTTDQAKQILEDHGITSNHNETQGSVSSMMKSMGLSIREWNEYRDLYFDNSKFVKPNEKLILDFRTLKLKFTIIVLTNNTDLSTKRILERIGFNGEKTIDLVLTSDHGLELKPHKESFIYIKNKFNIEFSEMVSIGDRYSVDIQPVLDLGGNGIQISDTSDISTISSKLTTSGWEKD